MNRFTNQPPQATFNERRTTWRYEDDTFLLLSDQAVCLNDGDIKRLTEANNSQNGGEIKANASIAPLDLNW